MSILRKIIYILTCTFLCSCAADYDGYYPIYDNNITMGNFVNGEFITDQGLSYHIAGQVCDGDLQSIERAMISCDILSKTDESRYNIILTGLEEIFTKAPVDSTSITDTDMLVENPLNLGEVWYSGGYLNMLVSVPIKEDSKQKHLVNLVRNDENPQEGVYEFTFKHNAHGEVITAQDTAFVQANRYVSFPVSPLFKQDEKKVQIILKWTSNIEKDGIWTSATQKNKISLDIERTGYEHKFEE